MSGCRKRALGCGSAYWDDGIFARDIKETLFFLRIYVAMAYLSLNAFEA
jgi:hypothetical protein